MRGLIIGLVLGVVFGAGLSTGWNACALRDASIIEHERIDAARVKRAAYIMASRPTPAACANAARHAIAAADLEGAR